MATPQPSACRCDADLNSMGRYFSEEPTWLPEAPRICALVGVIPLKKDWQKIGLLDLRLEMHGDRIALRESNRSRYLTLLAIDRLVHDPRWLDISNDAEPDDCKWANAVTK